MNSTNQTQPAPTTTGGAEKEKIVVIGGGTIGEALIGGLIAAGWDPEALTVVNRREERNQHFQERYRVHATVDAPAAVSGAAAVVVAVKPYAVADVLRASAGAARTAVFVSMAAGVTLETMAAAVGEPAALARVMPNTPMVVGAGTSIVCWNAAADDAQRDLVLRMMRAVGTAVEVEEPLMDAATAMSGSSPAYYYLVIEAMMDAGVQLGLQRSVARQLAVGAMEGAARMMAQSPEDPAVLRGKVQSPGGSTIAAVRELERHGVRAAIFSAAEACARRSAELG